MRVHFTCVSAFKVSIFLQKKKKTNLLWVAWREDRATQKSNLEERLVSPQEQQVAGTVDCTMQREELTSIPYKAKLLFTANVKDSSSTFREFTTIKLIYQMRNYNDTWKKI